MSGWNELQHYCSRVEIHASLDRPTGDMRLELPVENI